MDFSTIKRKITNGILSVILSLGLCGPAAAQQKDIDDQTLSWWCYFGTFRVSDKWSVWTELQLRRSEFVREWQQVLPRVGINYHYRDNIMRYSSTLAQTSVLISSIRTA